LVLARRVGGGGAGWLFREAAKTEHGDILFNTTLYDKQGSTIGDLNKETTPEHDKTLPFRLTAKKTK